MKEGAPQSRGDFELNSRVRAPAIADVPLRFSCEVRLVASLGIKPGALQFYLDPTPSSDIAAADMNDCGVPIFTVDGKNSVTVLEGNQTFRLIEIRTCNVKVTIVRFLQSLEQVQGVIFPRNGPRELGRAGLNTAAVRGEDERWTVIALVNPVIDASYFGASEFIECAVPVRHSAHLSQEQPGRSW